MTLQEFKTAMGVKAPKGRYLYPYRVGSNESIRITQDTVDVIFILKAQGMMQKDIATGMWISAAIVSKILNERCAA